MKGNKRSILSLMLMLSVSELPLAALAQNQPPKPQPTPTTEPKKRRSTWEAILTLFRRRKEPNLGSRGVCPIGPGLLEEQNIIWSDRPLFLWQGTNPPMEIRLYSPFDPKQEQQVIWRQNLTQTPLETTFQRMQYTGQPLQPGKIYDWEIFNLSDKYKLRRSFQVMGVGERDRMSGELQSLEAQLRVEQATDEEIALERAYYFARQNLWSDALQAMSAAPNPSIELTQKIQELLSFLCNTPNSQEKS
jgi:hypothetical protein